MKRAAALMLCVSAMVGCGRANATGPETGRYQIASNDRGNIVLRLDTATGEIKVLLWSDRIGMFEPQAAVAPASQWADYIKTVNEELAAKKEATERFDAAWAEREKRKRARMEPCLRSGKSHLDCELDDLKNAQR